MSRGWVFAVPRYFQTGWGRAGVMRGRGQFRDHLVTKGELTPAPHERGRGLQRVCNGTIYQNINWRQFVIARDNVPLEITLAGAPSLCHSLAKNRSSSNGSSGIHFQHFSASAFRILDTFFIFHLVSIFLLGMSVRYYPIDFPSCFDPSQTRLIPDRTDQG